MTATPLTPVTPKGPFIAGQPAATALNFAFAACDAVNGNSFPCTGHELLILFNSDSGAHDVTITSQPDSRGRTQDVTAYSIGAGLYAMFAFVGSAEGWADGSGNVTFTAADATVKAAVIKITR